MVTFLTDCHTLCHFETSAKMGTPDAYLLAGYIFINILFGLLYFFFGPIAKATGFFDYLYFFFVTGLTIGFGDYAPCTGWGKGIVMIHGMLSTFYSAMMVAFLGVKMLSHPYSSLFRQGSFYWASFYV